jgi:four helix bundle protein
MDINRLSPIRDPQSAIKNLSNPRSAICNQKSLQSAICNLQSKISPIRNLQSAICNQKSLQSAIKNQQSSIPGGLMDAEELKTRTKQFGLRVIRLVEALPNTQTAHTLGSQLIRAGTSVGANYRSACRGRSKAEFVAKISISIEEAHECLYWWNYLLKLVLFPNSA